MCSSTGFAGVALAEKSEAFQLKCRECGKYLGNAPRSFCEECFSPVEVAYDFAGLRGQLTRERIASRPANIWRYRELLPLTDDHAGTLPVGFTPLVQSAGLARELGLKNLYIKNDAVCFPTLSFKDRVVALALAAARRFGFDVVGCSSTGNLANAVAAQAAREGLQSWIFIPEDLENAKVLGTRVFGANVVKIRGNYDQVNRLCSQIADRLPWGFVNVNLRPYYAEGSKTVGFEIAEQLGWRLPDNVVVPMAGGSLITKIQKAFRELVELGLVKEKNVKFFGAQATGCSPISKAVKDGVDMFDPQKPKTIARSLAIGNPADGYYAIRGIRSSGGWAEDATDQEIVAGIELLASTEGIFTETAGGVTTAVTTKLVEQGRIRPEETTVVCITGNGLKTLDAIAEKSYEDIVIEPKLPAFANCLEQVAGIRVEEKVA